MKLSISIDMKDDGAPNGETVCALQAFVEQITAMGIEKIHILRNGNGKVIGDARVCGMLHDHDLWTGRADEPSDEIMEEKA